MSSALVGNLHSVALIDLRLRDKPQTQSWEPSFCSLDRLKGGIFPGTWALGTFIL